MGNSEEIGGTGRDSSGRDGLEGKLEGLEY